MWFKKYFEDFVDVCKNSEALPVLQRIKSQPTDIIISKEKNNLTKKVDKTFIPFPYYFFAEFTNLSSDNPKVCLISIIVSLVYV